MLSNIPEDNQITFLTELMDNYVGSQGLGAMPKGDLDALILYLYIKHTGTKKVDVFSLSQTFKIRESRVKSLIETGWIKFAEDHEPEVWLEIINSFSRVSIELESLEKGQIRFKLENPAQFRYLQKQVRQLESTATYSRTSEQVIMQFDTFNNVINRVYETVIEDPKDVAHEPIKAIYRKIRNEIIGTDRFESYHTGDKKETKLGEALTKASELAGITALVIDAFGAGGIATSVVAAANISQV